MNLHIISYPTFFEGEAQVVSSLLCQCDVVFHLRKPEAKPEDFKSFLDQIPPILHYKIVLHDAYELADSYDIKGFHFSTKKRQLASNYTESSYKSTSCHSLDEIKEVSKDFNACFLSPIFPSLSKKGYSGNLNFDAIQAFLAKKRKIQVIALAGIEVNKLSTVQQMGFDGAAVLGAIWGENPTEKHDFVEPCKKLLAHIARPFCLSIAGFDPSAGAGVLSDIKAFESNFCYGLGVSTALTYQNDEEFKGVRWLSFDEIKAQIDPLKKYPVNVIKIGLIESFNMLEQIVLYCKSIFPKAKIIWDPILKASAGFSFHSNKGLSDFLNTNIDVITPNADEYEQLALYNKTFNNTILLKGGHRKERAGSDTLIFNNTEVHIEGLPFKNKIDKHGTGCVLSSVIAANLAKGNDLNYACKNAKRYVEQFIQSNQSGLGYHS